MTRPPPPRQLRRDGTAMENHRATLKQPLYYERHDPYYPPPSNGEDRGDDRVDGIERQQQQQQQQLQQQGQGEVHGEQDKGDDDDGSVFLMDVYEFKQKHGYCSIIFSVVQTIIMILMMWQCGIAPININPMIGPYPDALNYWGAKNAMLIIDDGENWRLLTPILLHAGLLHLVGNVHIQLETGVFFEKEWGSPVWLVVYLVSGLGSSIFSTCFKPDVISVGSSGAIMGIFGAKLSEIFCRACESRETREGKIGHAMRMQQLWASLGCVVIVMLFSFIPYVDWAAHLGGLLAGMAVGLVIWSFSIQTWFFRILWLAVGSILTIVFFAKTVSFMNNDVEPVEELRDVCEYYKQFYEEYECRCQKNE